jgi:hypothetical protein
MQKEIDDLAIAERQWKRHVRIKFAKAQMAKAGSGETLHWAGVLAKYGVRPNGSILPSTTTLLDRSIINDERTASAKIAVAEVSKE